MIQLTYEEIKFYNKQEVCHMCKKRFCTDEHDENYKNKKKVKDHCHSTRKFRGAAHSDCNLKYKVPNNIPIVIHNASYDTHFIINQLAEEFKGELDCIGENMEKYITFSVPIKKCNDCKTITKRLMFIDSFRFMSASLSDLVDNLSGVCISKVCTKKNKKKNKKCVERNKINFECSFAGLKGDRLEYKCRECGEKWHDSING